MPNRIQIRRDTTERWTTVNPVLAIGEPAADITTGELRVGDGATRYLDLPTYMQYDPTTGLLPDAVMDSLDGRYQQLAAQQLPTITVEYKQNSTGYYAVTTAHVHGHPLAAMVDKRFGNDFDEKNPGTTGSDFAPVKERVDSFARRMGATVASNASGWMAQSSNGEMWGAQIRNGVAFHDFNARDLSGAAQGTEALGLMPDGRLKCFSALRGDTVASMVAEGVIHSWSYGPNLVIDGIPRDLTAASWGVFLTYVSPRTIIGQKQNGDIVIIATVGSMTGNAIVDLAVAEGLYNACVFDGGGSTQSYTQGAYSIPSSDSGTVYDMLVGRRSVPDCFALYGVLATPSIDTNWVPLTLASGFVSNYTSSPPAVRQVGLEVRLRGSIKPSSGAFTTPQQTIATVPPQFRTHTAAGSKVFLGVGNSSDTVTPERKVYLDTSGNIVLGVGPATPSYINVDGLGYFADGVL